MSNKYIQIHTITGYSTTLLNRDDAGMAKRMTYGGSVRTRTSSQSIKRKMRVAEGSSSLSALGDLSVRSCHVYDRLVAGSLIEQGLDETKVYLATLALMNFIYGNKVEAEDDASKKDDKPKKKKVVEEKSLQEQLVRKELVIYGRNEIEYLKSIVSEFTPLIVDNDIRKVQPAFNDFAALKKLKKNLSGINNTSLDMAAFGRMVTGDCLSTMDAAVHVAHAITIHAQHSDVDFFTAVDDLGTKQDDSVAHLGETEINSPLLYGYYVIDWNQLVENLIGLDDPEATAKEMVSRIIELASTQIVGAKKGSTAPYSTADFLMVEVGSSAPRTLAEAFRKPTAGTLEAGVEVLASYINKKDEMYGNTSKRSVMSMIDVNINDATNSNMAGVKLATIEAI